MEPAQPDKFVVLSAQSHSLGRSALATTAASGLFVLAGYVINVVLGRTLGPVDYGLFGIVIGLLTVINALQTAGLPHALARFTAHGAASPADLLTTAGVIQMAIGVVLGALLFLVAAPLSQAFGDTRLAPLLEIAALTLPAYALFSVLWGAAGGSGYYQRQAGMLSVYAVAKGGFAVGLGLVLAVPGAIVGYILGPLVGSLAAGRRTLRRGRLVTPLPLLQYALPLIVMALLAMALLHADLFLVKALVADPAAAGHYTAAQSIARVPYFLMVGFTTMLLPAIARALSGSPEEAANVARQGVRFGVLIVAPIAALLAGASGEIVTLLYGIDYAPAAAALLVLGPAMAVFALAGLLASILAGVGRPGRAAVGTTIGLAIAVITATVLVPLHGLAGAGVATLAGSAAALVIGVLATRHALRFDLPWTGIGKSVGAAIAVLAVASILSGPIDLLVGAPLLAVAYLVVLVATREIGRDELSKVMGQRPRDSRVELNEPSDPR